jgi:hypothetical protein
LIFFKSRTRSATMQIIDIKTPKMLLKRDITKTGIIAK